MENGDVVKLYCRSCSKETNTQVMASYNDRWCSDDEQIDGSDYFCVIKCRGCDSISFVKESYFSEDVDIRINQETGEFEQYYRQELTQWPPKAARPSPDWLQKLSGLKEVRLLFVELYRSLNADASVLSSIAVRTIFDAISTELGICESLTFKEKLDQLVTIGKISTSERTTLEILVDAGSAAAHRGWRPKTAELNQLVNILEHFAQRVLLLEKETSELKSKIPAKKRVKKINSR